MSGEDAAPRVRLGGWGPTLRATYKTLEISARFLLREPGEEDPQARGDRLLREWAAAVARYADVTLSVSGASHITPGASYVVMSNHASFFDIPALYGAFPGRLRMVGKAELFRVPIWGQAMEKAGMVAIDRGDRSAAIAQLASAEALVKGGTSVWISPEGTRTTTGALSPFKKGGFHVALNIGAPILPAYLSGTPDAMPAGAFRIARGAHISVRFGAPIPVPPGGAADLGLWMQEVEAAIRALKAAGQVEEP